MMTAVANRPAWLHRLLPGLILLAVALAGGPAAAQLGCFGTGSVKTCIGGPQSPMFQVNCFGSKRFQTCQSVGNIPFTLSSNVPGASSTSAFQSGSGAAPPSGAAGAARRQPGAPALSAPGLSLTVIPVPTLFTTTSLPPPRPTARPNPPLPGSTDITPSAATAQPASPAAASTDIAPAPPTATPQAQP